MPLLILFLFVSVIEVLLFIEIGGIIGVGWTLFTVIATALVGTALVRAQGLSAWMRAREIMDVEQRVPWGEVFTGLCLLVAGVMLVTPGFFTDTFGFLLLVPAVRRGLGVALGTLWFSRRSGRY